MRCVCCALLCRFVCCVLNGQQTQSQNRISIKQQSPMLSAPPFPHMCHILLPSFPPLLLCSYAPSLLSRSSPHAPPTPCFSLSAVTAIGIYCGTNPNELERIVNKASNARPSECGELNDAMFWRRSKNKNYKMIPHHSMTLSLATQERRSQLSDCSLFNVIFNTTMNPEYCTYQYDTNQLPNGVKHIIISKLRGDNVILHDPYDVYTDILGKFGNLRRCKIRLSQSH